MVEHVDDAEHGVLGLVAVNNTGASMASKKLSPMSVSVTACCSSTLKILW